MWPLCHGSQFLQAGYDRTSIFEVKIKIQSHEVDVARVWIKYRRDGLYLSVY